MLAVLVGLALGVRATRGVAAPILLALVVSIGTSPLIGILVKRRVPPLLAYIISLLVITGILLAALALVSFMIIQMTDILPDLEDQLTSLQDDAAQILAQWGIDISRLLQDQVFRPENIIGWISAALGAVYNALKSISLIVFIVAYMLFEVSGFRARFFMALGEDRPALRRWMLWTRDTRSYLWITTVLAVLVTILNFILLWALQVPYPFTWAFLSFVLSYVPSVGFLIALLPPVALGILQRSWGMAAGVFVGYLVINFVSDNILKPRFLRAGMDLPAVVSFLSVLIWGFVLGPIGALLAVPMTMMVRTIFLEASPETEQLAMLLRSGPQQPRVKKRRFWWLRRTTGGTPPPESTPPGDHPREK